MTIVLVATYCLYLDISEYVVPSRFSLQPGSSGSLHQGCPPKNRMASPSLRCLTNCSTALSFSQTMVQWNNTFSLQVSLAESKRPLQHDTKPWYRTCFILLLQNFFKQVNFLPVFMLEQLSSVCTSENLGGSSPQRLVFSVYFMQQLLPIANVSSLLIICYNWKLAW